MDCVQSPAAFTRDNVSLQTPQPHYIPGYTGHVPQEKYRPGHTYGITSHRVLLDPCIAMSPRSVLNNVHPEHCSDEFGRPGLGSDPVLSAQMALVNSRVNSLGRQQYQPNMTPGYTGFVPRFQTILGHTYSPACNRALARFEQDQWRDRLFTKELEALDGWRFCYKRKPWETNEVCRPPNTDLQEFRRAPPAIPVGGCGCAGGRGLADTMANPMTSSGGGGCGGGCGSGSSSGSLMTPGYSVCDYAQRRIWGIGQEAGMNMTCGNIVPKVNAFRFSHPPNRVQEIYRHCEGMIPNYQGHVPGAIFRTGVTYGTATRNPKRHMEPALHKPLCFPVRG